jgi:hypothetical protein
VPSRLGHRVRTTDEERRRNLEAERRRLVLAESDMRQAEGAAQSMQTDRGEAASRVFWTGPVVTYARPFSKGNKAGAIGGELDTPADASLRPLHDNLLKRRNDLFAYNDVTATSAARQTSTPDGK